MKHTNVQDVGIVLYRMLRKRVGLGHRRRRGMGSGRDPPFSLSAVPIEPTRKQRNPKEQ